MTSEIVVLTSFLACSLDLSRKLTLQPHIF